MPDAQTMRRIGDLQEVSILSPGMFVAVDSPTHGTVKYDLGTYVHNASGEGLQFDTDSGEYVIETVANVFSARRDGLAYGVSVPKGSAVACTKLGANAGLAVPTPGTIGTPAIDPYVGRGPFFFMEANGTVDADGAFHVTAIHGDGRFRRDGTNGDVWILAPVLWWSKRETQDAVELFVSDSKLSGMSAQPQAYLPDGSLRPFMAYAKYPGVKGLDGYMHSYSGYKPWTRAVSHNSCITQCRTATTGCSGKSIADDWYVKMMFLLKYATTNSQGVFAGCTNYNYQYSPAVAETGTTRVVLTTAQADTLLVGSSMMLGTHTGNSDRGTASNFDVFDGARILRIEEYDATHKAVYFDVAASFDTEITYLLSTAPWHTGVCDMVEGDGSPTSPLGGKEPFVIQGIELAHGMYEVLGDVIISNEGNGWEICVNHDSRNEATSVTTDYTRTGKCLPADSTDGWKYPMYPDDADGLLFGTGTGGSSTTGMCDGTYTNKLETLGTREWLSLGGLHYAAIAGLWCVIAYNGLGTGGWGIGGRLSATGRSRAA